MKQFTIRYRERFPEILKQYLLPSIEKLKGEFDVIKVNGGIVSEHSDFIADNYKKYKEIFVNMYPNLKTT